jgi:hypothetical protein
MTVPDKIGEQGSLGDAFVGPPKKDRPKRLAGFAPAQWSRARRHVEEAMASGDWEGTTCGHLLALYAVLHERVYGVAASELEVTKERTIARQAAARMLRAEFADDVAQMVVFMRWCWSRESAYEKRRRASGQVTDFRVGWRYQFNGKLLTDWRRAALQAGGA